MINKRLKVSCSLGFLAVVAFLIYLDGWVVLIWLISCVFHELGHIAMIKILGGSIKSFRLTAVGAVLELNEEKPLSYREEAAAALAGPLINLLLAALCAGVGEYSFSSVNLSLGVLNLLPVMPLDGGRIMLCLISGLQPDRTTVVMKTVSITVCGVLIGLSYYSWLRWGNLTLLIGSLWLAFITIK